MISFLTALLRRGEGEAAGGIDLNVKPFDLNESPESSSSGGGAPQPKSNEIAEEENEPPAPEVFQIQGDDLLPVEEEPLPPLQPLLEVIHDEILVKLKRKVLLQGRKCGVVVDDSLKNEGGCSFCDGGFRDRSNRSQRPTGTSGPIKKEFGEGRSHY